MYQPADFVEVQRERDKIRRGVPLLRKAPTQSPSRTRAVPIQGFSATALIKHLAHFIESVAIPFRQVDKGRIRKEVVSS